MNKFELVIVAVTCLLVAVIVSSLFRLYNNINDKFESCADTNPNCHIFDPSK